MATPPPPSHSERIQAALFNLSVSIHDARNNTVYSPAEKVQLGNAFDAITTRMALVQLNAATVNQAAAADVDAIETQCASAGQLLDAARTKPKRRHAISETFEVFPMVDALL